MPGFQRGRIATSGAELAVRHAGSGPPVLLLHGYPQTSAMWHLVAPKLAQRFTVVVPDLRGYGDSSKPKGDDDHVTYSKRELAKDAVELMTALGHERFAVVGHDRGGRVAHRLALDHPKRVTALGFLDIVPTTTVWAASGNRAAALRMHHWFFLAQPYDLPERLIGGDPSFWLRWLLRAWSGGDDSFFDPDALAEYERCFADPASIHASCEDYRAGATIDVRHDEQDAGKRLRCPVLALWGSRAGLAEADVLGIWRERADQVQGRPLDAGHFVAEERPSVVTAELLAFLSRFAEPDA